MRAISLAVDLETKRPLCVLLQSIHGTGENNGFLSMTFDTEDWVVVPTKKMGIVTGTMEEWKRHAEQLRRRRINADYKRPAEL